MSSGRWLVNSEWCRKLSWPNLRYCLGTCLQGRKKPTNQPNKQTISADPTDEIRARDQPNTRHEVYILHCDVRFADIDGIITRRHRNRIKYEAAAFLRPHSCMDVLSRKVRVPASAAQNFVRLLRLLFPVPATGCAGTPIGAPCTVMSRNPPRVGILVQSWVRSGWHANGCWPDLVTVRIRCLCA
jgi:hypothetical protein